MVSQDLLIYFEHGPLKLSPGTYKFTGFTFKITNPNNYKLRAAFRGKRLYDIDCTESGIYLFPELEVTITENDNSNCGFELFAPIGTINDFNVTFEILPDYQGALVSDGVDDYGLCKNFPVFTKERGYTVCAIRKRIDGKGTLLSKRTERLSGYGDNIGAFQVERDYAGVSFSFGLRTNININNKLFIYQKSTSYCGSIINLGNAKDNIDLTLFSWYNNRSVGSFAIYALEIYDRDLTDEEIATVKARMIAEYEEKTGNKYEEETV